MVVTDLFVLGLYDTDVLVEWDRPCVADCDKEDRAVVEGDELSVNVSDAARESLGEWLLVALTSGEAPIPVSDLV